MIRRGIRTRGTCVRAIAAMRALIVVALCCSGCQAGVGEPARGQPPSALQIALLAQAAEAASELGLTVPAPDAAVAQLDQLVAQARKEVPATRSRAAIAALNRFLFDNLGLERELDDTNIPLMLLPQVVAGRRGTCLGLAALYLVVADRLGLDVHALLVPGHLFLRQTVGTDRVNIELLRRGEQLPDSWYVDRYQVPTQAPAYLRELSSVELVAVYRYNLANELHRRQRTERAAELYRQAIEAFPDFAEARGNLGLLYQLAGNRTAAAAAYQAAARANPALPGLAHNLAALGLADDAGARDVSHP